MGGGGGSWILVCFTRGYNNGFSARSHAILMPNFCLFVDVLILAVCFDFDFDFAFSKK